MNKMYWKAFLALFGGVAMFFCLTILPLMVFASMYFTQHDNSWITRYTLEWASAFIFAAGVMAWGMIASLDCNKYKHLVLLKLAVHDGKEMILWWNPVGWVILLGHVLRVTVLIIYTVFFTKHEDKLPEK